MAASLQFFLTRPGRIHTSTSTSRVHHGTHVPLIPVDQLPEWLHIVDVPRVLSDQHVAGLTHVGFVSQPQEAFEVFILEDQLSAAEHLLEQHEQTTPGVSRSTTDSHLVTAATVAKTTDHDAQRQKFGLKPGDFIKAQALGNAERVVHRGGGPVATERSISPEQLSATADMSRAHHDDDNDDDDDCLVTEGTSQPETSADRAALEKIIPDVRQRLQGDDDAPGERPSPERSGPVANLCPPESRRPVARQGLANSMHAPHAVPEQKMRSLSNKPPSSSRAPQQQGQQLKGPPPTAEARSHSRGRGTAQELGRGPTYCRHWCMHGTCKWGRNCRYHHAMPATLDGLAEAGLREFPEWWTTAIGLAARFGIMEQQQQQQQPPPLHDGDHVRPRQLARDGGNERAGRSSRLLLDQLDQEMHPAAVWRGPTAAAGGGATLAGHLGQVQQTQARIQGRAGRFGDGIGQSLTGR